jgi:hypothetical protein
MRRILTPAVRATVDWFGALARGWGEFWFKPADPALLGLLRILAGAMLIYSHAVWGLALADFFGPDSWLQADVVGALYGSMRSWSFSFWTFWWWIPPETIWWAHGAALFVLVLFTLGIGSRVTSLAAYVVAISYVHRVPSALFGLDQINAMLALYLAIGYATIPARDRSLSLDRRIARFRQERRGAEFIPARSSSGANLAVRLIQVHMCVIYFFAAISKLQGPSWWSGEAMWLAFANLEYQSADMTWLAHYPRIVNLMTHFTIAWELSFPVLIWLRQWRPLVLAGAVVLHVGIGACLGMWTFGLVMLIGCAAFLPQEFAVSLARVLSRRAAIAGPVLIADVSAGGETHDEPALESTI